MLCWSTIQSSLVVGEDFEWEINGSLLPARQNQCIQVYHLLKFGCCRVYRSGDKAINVSQYSRMDQVKFFKGCRPQILLGPFLNTLFQTLVTRPSFYNNTCLQSKVSAWVSGRVVYTVGFKPSIHYVVVVRSSSPAR